MTEILQLSTFTFMHEHILVHRYQRSGCAHLSEDTCEYRLLLLNILYVCEFGKSANNKLVVRRELLRNGITEEYVSRYSSGSNYRGNVAQRQNVLIIN